MTLFNLAKRNVVRNFSNYFLYIISMVFSIMIYFTFVTMKYSDDIVAEASGSQKISAVMSASAYVLIFFVAIFILYSNSFFLKKRKKEVGLYALLGVRKKQIGMLLFFETLFLGAVSLVIGIIGGFFASKFFLYILVKMMGLGITPKFTLSTDAIIQTAIVFCILFFITAFQGYRVVYKFKLIDLFHAEKQGDVIPKPNIFIALFGLAAIISGYVISLQDMVTSPVWKLFGMSTAAIILVLVVLGTYCIFHSLFGFCLTLVKKSEKFTWKNLRLITLSQLLYRIRSNAQTLTVIAILSATTITSGGAVFGLYYNTTQNVKEVFPHSYAYISVSDKQNKQIEKAFVDPEYVTKVQQVQIKFNVSQLNLMGSSTNDRLYNVISEKNYNKLAKNLKRSEVSLAGKDAMIITNIGYGEKESDYLNKHIFKGHLDFTLRKVITESVLTPEIGPNIVVSNAMYESLAKSTKQTTAVAVDDTKANDEDAKKVMSLMTEKNHFYSQSIVKQGEVENIGVILFVGSFLGLVFLVATGSIIYFKVLTEAEADKEKYRVLHKLGVRGKAMRGSIATQVAIFFSVPLVFGLIHSSVALIALSKLLNSNITVPVMIWMGIYIVIFGAYYVLTVFSYNRIIRQTIRNEGTK